jgi:DNA-binding XRE family transcriptional regulator
MVHSSNVERIKNFVAKIEPAAIGGISLDDFYSKHFGDQPKHSVSLQGIRYREDMTQRQLSDVTGIPQRHISEMENGKRAIGKEAAKKLAAALNCDYRTFL